jgi:DNA-binding NarL/FixJ family response regulator
MMDQTEQNAHEASGMTKVLIFDDDPGLLKRMASAISSLADVRIVGQVSDLAMLESLFGVKKPDVLVMRLPPLPKQLQVVRDVKAHDPTVTMIVLSNNPSLVYHREWKKAGADFYFDTTEAIEFLPDLFTWKSRTFHDAHIAERKAR